MYSQKLAKLIHNQDWTEINGLIKHEFKRGIGYGLLVTDNLNELATRKNTNAADLYHIMDRELLGLLQAIERYRAFWENVLHQEQFDEYMVTH